MFLLKNFFGRALSNNSPPKIIHPPKIFSHLTPPTQNNPPPTSTHPHATQNNAPYTPTQRQSPKKIPHPTKTTQHTLTQNNASPITAHTKYGPTTHIYSS